MKEGSGKLTTESPNQIGRFVIVSTFFIAPNIKYQTQQKKVESSSHSVRFSQLKITKRKSTQIIFRSLAPKSFFCNERFKRVPRVPKRLYWCQLRRTAVLIHALRPSKATHENFGAFDHCLCGHVHHGHFWQLECVLCHPQNSINEIRYQLLPLFSGCIRLIDFAFRYGMNGSFISVFALWFKKQNSM